MSVLIAEDPDNFSNVISLMQSIKENEEIVICSHYNLFSSNFAPKVLIIQWPENFFDLIPLSELSSNDKLTLLDERLAWFKSNNSKIIFIIKYKIPETDFDNFQRSKFISIVKYSDKIIFFNENNKITFENKYSFYNNKYKIVCDYGLPKIYPKLEKNIARNYLGLPHDKFVLLTINDCSIVSKNNFINRIFKILQIENKHLVILRKSDTTSSSYLEIYYNKVINKLYSYLLNTNKIIINNNFNDVNISNLLSAADALFIENNDEINLHTASLGISAGLPIIHPNNINYKMQLNPKQSFEYENNDISSAILTITNVYNQLPYHNNDYSDMEWTKNHSWKSVVNEIKR
jgi:hypothetical protein